MWEYLFKISGDNGEGKILKKLRNILEEKSIGFQIDRMCEDKVEGGIKASSKIWKG